MRSYKTHILLMLAVALMGASAFASNVQRFNRDMKLPTQVVMEHQQWAIPLGATTNYIKTTTDGPSSAAAYTMTSFTHQPDYPRNITITPTGTTGDVESCAVVVNGTNFYDAVITETLTFSADASSAQTGSKAFKTITSIVWPASCESGGFAATWIVGIGTKLGMKRCTDVAGKYVFSNFNNAYETTRGTMAASTGVIGSNTFIPNGSMDGAKPVDLYFIQDFSCSP